VWQLLLQLGNDRMMHSQGNTTSVEATAEHATLTNPDADVEAPIDRRPAPALETVLVVADNARNDGCIPCTPVATALPLENPPSAEAQQPAIIGNGTSRASEADPPAGLDDPPPAHAQQLAIIGTSNTSLAADTNPAPDLSNPSSAEAQQHAVVSETSHVADTACFASLDNMMDMMAAGMDRPHSSGPDGAAAFLDFYIPVLAQTTAFAEQQFEGAEPELAHIEALMSKLLDAQQVHAGQATPSTPAAAAPRAEDLQSLLAEAEACISEGSFLGPIAEAAAESESTPPLAEGTAACVDRLVGLLARTKAELERFLALGRAELAHMHDMASMLAEAKAALDLESTPPDVKEFHVSRVEALMQQNAERLAQNGMLETAVAGVDRLAAMGAAPAATAEKFKSLCGEGISELRSARAQIEPAEAGSAASRSPAAEPALNSSGATHRLSSCTDKV
jgi:hypothetical protein